MISRTTHPLDAEINLPDTTPYPALSVETQWYKEWQDSFVSENPVEAQINLFDKLAALVKEGKVDVEFYRYWYNKANLSHPVVFASISANEVFPEVNETTGSLYYTGVTPTNTPNSSLGVTPIFPFEGNLAHIFPTGVTQYVTNAYLAVNSQYSDNLANITSGSPTSAHGTSLVKDTVAVGRNTESHPRIKEELRTKYKSAFDLLNIAEIITGNVEITRDTFTTNVEGTNVIVDTLTNKVDPEISPLNNDTLGAV